MIIQRRTQFRRSLNAGKMDGLPAIFAGGFDIVSAVVDENCLRRVEFVSPRVMGVNLRVRLYQLDPSGHGFAPGTV